MANRLLPGYQKADVHNLPVVDLDMMTNYIKSNENFYTPESRCVKAARAGRESYGDSAIGYVQLKRTDGICNLIANIAPEHKVRSKSYRVECVINIEEGSVSSVKCLDCIASQGGCKHGLAVLGWLYRKSESRSVTEVDCYWKKSTLSKVGESIKYIELDSLSKSKKPSAKRQRKETPPMSFLKEVLEDISTKQDQDIINFDIPDLYYHKQDNDERNFMGILDIHHLIENFKKKSKGPINCCNFVTFCKSEMTEHACTLAATYTSEQSKNAGWYKLR